jgi:hypothetical protein
LKSDFVASCSNFVARVTPALERILNEQLILVSKWLCANKLSLNIEKPNFVLFHPPQKKVN